MNEPGTRQIGPFGSTIHILRADAETIVELAALNHSWPVDSRYRKIGREHAGRPPGEQESAGPVSGCDGT